MLAVRRQLEALLVRFPEEILQRDGAGGGNIQTKRQIKRMAELTLGDYCLGRKILAVPDKMLLQL
ncbi:hypothetical protein D3C75_1001140 [compost metagenome]